MTLDAMSPAEFRPSFLKLAMANDLPARALSVSIIVGTVLTLINQGDLLFLGKEPNFWKMGLTYLVPYCVATYGAVSAMQKAAASERPVEWATAVLPPPVIVAPVLPVAEAPPPGPDTSREDARQAAAAALRRQAAEAATEAAALRDRMRGLVSLLAAAEPAAPPDAAHSRRLAQATETVAQLARRMHLTALNGSLESVRAGAAGSGVATIAGDLNQLARQVMAGMDDLRRQIAAMDGGIGTVSAASPALRDAATTAQRQLVQATALTDRIEMLGRDAAVLATA